ncbi:PAS domain-containing protein [Cyclobacterium jeungdonense]|uniref:histidine kinase n=1 Tax=Cyclobacterium jeungdonense TaxID=708087 RepID=A0ABT8CAI3_9BACT|nr:PAS domain-containing protein [Cyclobacterium jeungdonense]MDN3689814.1 PAS domain-containing protein [Cyclobacterium jeungdonense]
MGSKKQQQVEGVLAAYGLLNGEPEKDFDAISQLASVLFSTPISLLTVLTEKKQYFKSRIGTDRTETSVEESFCRFSMENPDEVMVVADTRKDPRFKDNPMVTGDPKIVFYAGVPIFTPEGHPVGALCVIDHKPRSIEPEKLAALKSLGTQVKRILELRKSNQDLELTRDNLQKETHRLSNILEATQVGTWEWNMETDQVVINACYAEMVGYSKEELSPFTMETWYTLVHPEDRNVSDKILEECFSKKRDYYNIECRLIHKEGHLVWINDRGKVTKWSEDDRPLMMSGTHTDITERKNREIQFQSISDNIPGVVYRYRRYSDGTDALELVSNGASRLWGISPEMAMKDNQLIWDRYHREDYKVHLEKIYQSAKHLSFWTHEWRYLHPDGSTRWHKGMGNPSNLKDGSIVWDAVILDITKQKEAEIDLKNTFESLNERVKEQQCLYRITQLTNSVFDWDSLLDQAVEIIPTGWKHSESAIATIHYGSSGFFSSGFSPFSTYLTSSYGTIDEKKLTLRVGYPIGFQRDERDLFLKEEVRLLDTLAAHLGAAIDQLIAETAMKLSNERVNTLVRNINGIFWEADFQTSSMKFLSPQVSAILGYTVKEWMESENFWEEHIHEDDKDRIFTQAKDKIKAGEDYTLEYRMQAKNGNWIWFNDLVQVEEVQGRGTYLRGLMVDVTERKVAEEALEKSEKRFKALVQAGSDLIAILSNDSEYLYVSPNYTVHVGYEENEILGTKAIDKFHPDDRERVIAEFAGLAQKKRIKCSPYRFKRKDGSWCWLQSVATDLSGDPAVGGIVVNSVEITELIEAQERLKKSEARYRGFYESQTNYVLRTDMEGKYTYVNKKFIEDFGWIYPDGKIIGQSSLPSICEYDHQKVIEVVEKCLNNPEIVFKIEIDKPRQGGGTVTTLWDFICIVDGGGIPHEIQCMGIDISDRIEFERELKKNNERYEYVNRATKDAIYEWDVVADEFLWGEGFYRIFGFDKGEQISKISDWGEFMHPVDAEKNKDEWEQFLTNPEKKRWHKNFRFRHKSGTYLFTEEIAHLIRDESGEPLRMIGVLRDISEVKKASLLRELEHEISGFFKNEVNLNETLFGVLEYLSHYGGYVGGEIWMVGIKGKQLNMVQSYWRNGKLARIAGNTGSFSYGSGLPGKVWQDGIPQIFENLSEFPSLSRKKLLTSGNLKEAAGIPLLQKEQVVGVLLLFGEKQGNGILTDSHVFQPLGAFLGAEIRRKQQEEEMMLLFESAPEILAITDPDGYFVKVNPAFCQLLGYSSEELVSRPFTDFIHTEDLAKTKQEFPNMFTSDRKVRNFVNRYRTKSGAVRWISWNSSEVFGEEGLVFSYGHDISEMVKLQELLDNATQLSRVGSWEIDLKKEKLFLSTITREIYELPNDQFPNLEEAINFYRPDVREFLTETINETIQSGNPWDVQLPLITHTGKEKWVRSIGKAEFEEGKCTRLFGSIQDIHEQKTNEIQLTKNNRLLEVISKVIGKFLLVENWSQVLSEVFELTGKTISVDRVYFFQRHPHPNHGKPVISQTAEWSRKGIPSQLHNPDLQNMELDDYPEIYQRLQKGEPYAKNRRDLQAGKLKDILEAQGIVSTLAMPVIIDNEFNGLLGFDDCEKDRSWSENELSFLQTIAANLSSAIQRRNSQLALQQSFEEKNAILESIGEAFFALDNDWKIRYWNQRAEQLMGVNRSQLLGQVLFEVFPDAKKYKFQRQYINALETQSPVHFEEYFDPLNTWLEVNAYPSDEGLSVFIKDITKEKIASENVRQSNERFEKIAEATNDAIWDFDVENNRLFWGRGFQTLFGYDLESLTPTLDLLVSFIHPDDREKVASKIQQFLESETLTNWFEEYRFLQQNGFYAFVMDRAIFIRNQEGKVTRVVGAMTDITYRKEYEESLEALNQQMSVHSKELERSNLELEQFAYVASHDLQEPLRMVSSFMGLLERKYGPDLDEKAHQYIRFAIDGAKRMRQIILDLLEFSRIGKHEDSLKLISISQIVDEVCVLQKRIIREGNAKVIYGELPSVISYRAPLMQVFQNLIGNALKYKRPDNPPQIEIQAEAAGDFWRFFIKDNGIGIDPIYHEKIFIIFNRLHNNEEYTGTGMGLAIVKKIIENLGGTIGVESAKGNGSTFYFTLPRPSGAIETSRLENEKR